MASGVPVVTSQCHGVNAFCTHGVNALIGPSQDATHLALLVSLVLRDPAVRCAVGGVVVVPSIAHVLRAQRSWLGI